MKGKELGKIDAWELEHRNGYSSWNQHDVTELEVTTPKNNNQPY